MRYIFRVWDGLQAYVSTAVVIVSVQNWSTIDFDQYQQDDYKMRRIKYDDMFPCLLI